MPEKGKHAFHELDMVVTTYGERGLCTVLYWSDGTAEEAPVKARTMVQRIAEAYGKTPQAIRRHWRHVYQAAADEQFGRMAILAISPGVVLMPVKLAMKMVGRDVPIGYVNLAQPVQFLEEKDGNGARSRIVFRQNEHVLVTAWTCKTLWKHWAAARRFWLEEEERHSLERNMVERANVYLGWYVN